jgi:hypothetical protein
MSPIILTSSFPFLEGQTGKSIYCSSSDYSNPTATATWTAQYGTPDVADTRKLILSKLTYQVDRSPVSCQLKNLFTQKKGLQIQSIQVLLQVECKKNKYNWYKRYENDHSNILKPEFRMLQCQSCSLLKD